MKRLKKELPFIITMAVFIIACIAVTAFTAVNEPAYVRVIPSERPEQPAVIDESLPRINLNTATLEELQTLPSIGERRATDIIAYREEHGRFLALEELMEIRGIGESVFAGILPLIYID
jgi:comEA protein